jgi:hypothetical protein
VVHRARDVVDHLKLSLYRDTTGHTWAVGYASRNGVDSPPRSGTVALGDFGEGLSGGYRQP